MSTPAPKKKATKSRSWVTWTSPEAAIQRGIALQQRDEHEEAARIYRSVLARQPDQVDALHFLGVAEHRLGRRERGLELVDRAIRLCPDHADLHNNRGNFLKLEGRLDEAEQSYLRAIELAPEHFNAISNLGTVARERGELQHAVTWFEEAIALAPSHYESHLHLGSTLRRMNRWVEASVHIERALELRPGDADAYHKLGATYYAMGRVEEAARVYRLWIATDPNNPVPRHLLAGCTGSSTPERASDDFVRASFSAFADHFENSLARLEYRAPALVAEALHAVFPEARAALDVLDAGCGTGLCAPDLRRYARSLVGVDLSPEMLDKARARASYDDLVVAELTAYTQQHPQRFDLVASADTFVYFGDLSALARGLVNTLRQGACLVFTVERSTEAEAPAGYLLHPHGRYSHSERYLRDTLRDVGLAVRACNPVQLRREAGKWVAGWLVTAFRDR